MNTETKLKELDEKSALITFLKLTKEGKYATIDKGSLIYTRLKEEREEIYDEENYYYGIS